MSMKMVVLILRILLSAFFPVPEQESEIKTGRQIYQENYEAVGVLQQYLEVTNIYIPVKVAKNCGTAFFVNPYEPIILTAYHVAGEPDPFVDFSNRVLGVFIKLPVVSVSYKFIDYQGREYPVIFNCASISADLAQLTVVGIHEWTYVKTEPYGDNLQGDRVYAIGNPRCLANSITTGIISGFNRNMNGIVNLIQTDCPLNPGNSGGPLFNERGYVIGVAERIMPDAQSMGFCTPISAYTNGTDTWRDEVDIGLPLKKGAGKK